MPAGFFEVSGCCSSRLSPAGHGCLRHSTNLSPLRSCPSHFGSLPPPSQTLLNSNLVPLHAAISVICLLCHLQNATPRLTVSTPPWFCLSDQFCAFSPAVPGSHRLAPHSWELCWGLGKPLLWQWDPLVVATEPWDPLGAWQGVRAAYLRGKSPDSADTVWLSPAWGKPCCLPRGHHHLENFLLQALGSRGLCSSKGMRTPASS